MRSYGITPLRGGWRAEPRSSIWRAPSGTGSWAAGRPPAAAGGAPRRREARPEGDDRGGDGGGGGRHPGGLHLPDLAGADGGSGDPLHRPDLRALQHPEMVLPRPPHLPHHHAGALGRRRHPNRTLRQLMHAWFSQRRHHRKKRSEDVHGRAADLLETLRRAKGRARVQFLKELHGLVSGHGGGAAQKAVADSGGIGFISSLLGPFTSHAVGSLAIAVLARLPLDYASRKNLLQPAKISLLADVLNEGSPETKLCCTRLLETLLQMDKQEEEEEEVVSSFSLLVGLLKMVKDKRSSPEGTSSGLRLLRFICCSHHQVRPVVVSVGAVPSLVERLPDLNRDCMESAWEILSALAEAPQGLQALRSCSQAVPNAVRVLMRVSEACTRHALSVLSAVCKSSPEECGSQAVEAGLAAKLLLVIQSDCSAPLKQRAAELLKLCSLNYTAALFISKCKLTRTIQ
ncbi:unnamed protein product [Spirodela intermedia]|uniref:U-box domain-containing protein n=1 Tax=Spirodela intermedia TaxID=51605 RepID=A0A7I8I8S9_SPIIN|nr:unnamed protein product [Spirodela intermedia]CAA6653472.1 unnamed protein product [Spirodela intermedia]